MAASKVPRMSKEESEDVDKWMHENNLYARFKIKNRELKNQNKLCPVCGDLVSRCFKSGTGENDTNQDK